MTFLTANNGTTTLGAAIATSDTSILVFTGTGARFPAVAAPDIMMLTLDDGNNVEIVKCTAHGAGSDTFTVVRAAELYQTTGSLSYAFSPTGSGTVVEARLTKNMVENSEPIRLLQQSVALSGVAPPDSGTLQLYARGHAGRALLKFMGPSGVDYIIQPGLYDSQLVMWRPGMTFPTGSGWGGSWTYAPAGGVVGGQVIQLAPTWSGSLSGSIKRAKLITPASSGSRYTMRPWVTSGSGIVWRGPGPNNVGTGAGGFFFFARVWMPSGSSNQANCYIGLAANTQSVAPFSYGPLQSPNSILVGYHGATGSYGGYASLRVGMAGTGSLGFTEVLQTNTSHSIGDNILDIYIYAAPSDSQAQIRVDKNNSDGSIVTLHDKVYTNFLPVTNTFLTPLIEIQSNIAAGASIDVISVYLESDY